VICFIKIQIKSILQNFFLFILKNISVWEDWEDSLKKVVSPSLPPIMPK
jgi:hypothetical protein